MAEIDDSTTTAAGPLRPLAVSVDEAGRLLGVSRDLVYDMVARTELVAVRLGRRIVIPIRSLEDLLQVADGGEPPNLVGDVAFSTNRDDCSGGPGPRTSLARRSASGHT